MTSRFYSRKWQLTIFIAVAGTAALWFDKIDGVQWSEIMIALILSYNIANAASKYVEKRYGQPD